MMNRGMIRDAYSEEVTTLGVHVPDLLCSTGMLAPQYVPEVGSPQDGFPPVIMYSTTQ